jgi:amino acid transporter
MAMYNLSRAQSNKLKPLPSEEYVVEAMPSILNTFDMLTLFLMAVFWITNTTMVAFAGPAALTYLLLNGLTFFLPCVIVTAQLGVLFPHEGSVYNWTYRALGRYWSFFVGLCFWFPGMLVIISGADAFVAYLQGLNSGWLGVPWQQGLVIIFLIAFSGVLATQRFRTIQNMVNIVIMFILLAVFLIMLSAVVWLVKGNPPATDFSHSTDWSLNLGNFSFFGLITFVFIGTNVPLNMSGEIVGAGYKPKRRWVIKRHLLWGTLIVLIGYFVCIASLLIVRGPVMATAPIVSFEWVTMVSMALGNLAGGFIAVCMMCFFLMASVVYNSALARLLLVGSIDQRLPSLFGKLNTNRVPVNAIIFQTFTAIVFTIFAFIIIPSDTQFGNPSDLASEVFNVSLASLTLVWTFATIFFFVDLVRIYLRNRLAFHLRRIFPMPVLWASIIIGPIACLATIVDTLLNSWIPQITNDKWLLIVGSLMLIFIMISAAGSMLASSQLDWEEISQAEQLSTQFKHRHDSIIYSKKSPLPMSKPILNWPDNI